MDVEGQLYALFYTILHKVLEQPKDLVSTEGTLTNPPWIQYYLALSQKVCQLLH